MAMEAMAGKNRTKVLTLPYHVALGSLIDPGFIEEEKLRLGSLFPQEYECAFLSPKNAMIEKELIDRNMIDGSSEPM